MADISKYTNEEPLFVSVCDHEKERTGGTYEEIRENFFLRFNEAAPSEANPQEAPTSQCTTTGCGPTLKKIFQLFRWILLNS